MHLKISKRSFKRGNFLKIIKIKIVLFVIVKGTVSVNSSASKCKDSQQCLIETIINNVEKIVKIDNS